MIVYVQPIPNIIPIFGGISRPVCTLPAFLGGQVFSFWFLVQCTSPRVPFTPATRKGADGKPTPKLPSFSSMESGLYNPKRRQYMYKPGIFSRFCSLPPFFPNNFCYHLKYKESSKKSTRPFPPSHQWNQRHSSR